MNEKRFNINKVFWERGRFKPWHITDSFLGQNLQEAKLNDDEEILVIEAKEFSLGFLKKEVIYHHVVQGKYAGKPFMISYCVMCNAGVVLEPIVNGEYEFFEAVGVYNGQLLMQDLKTKSLWNHLLGECLHGDYKGCRLNVSYLKELTFKDALSENPNLKLFVSGRYKGIKKVFSSGMKLLDYISGFNKNFLPGFFAKTIINEDKSLPRMTKGLMVKIDDQARFYESRKIHTGMTDEINGKRIRFFENKIPFALDEKEKRPFQIYMRWYAFKINYPDGHIFEQAGTANR